MVNELPSIATPKDLCTHYLEGKQHRKSIPKKCMESIEQVSTCSYKIMWAYQTHLNLVKLGFTSHMKSQRHSSF